MESGWLLVLVVVLGLLAAAALARGSLVAGWQRNALSVAIVVLGLIAAFMVFFAAGSLMRSKQQEAAPRAQAWPSSSGEGPAAGIDGSPAST